jgi:hypothetical protein
MARRRQNGFDTTMLEKYADQLDELGGSGALRWAVGDALRATKITLNRIITARMQASNLPAGGAYSTGATLEHLNKHYRETVEGNTVSLPLGFDLVNEGITSIFLMYGTPKHRPVPGLKEALYGNVARKQIREDQEKAMLNILNYLGGK